MTEPADGPAPADGRALAAELASFNALLNSPQSMGARIAALAAPSFIPFELPQPIPVEPPRPRRPIDLLSSEEIESRRTDLILVGQICELLENWEREVFFHIRGEVIARTKVRLFDEASSIPTTYDLSQSIAAPVSAETQAYWDEENRKAGERAETRRVAALVGADRAPAPSAVAPGLPLASVSDSQSEALPSASAAATLEAPKPKVPGSQALPSDFYLVPAETRLTPPQLQAVRDRLLYLNLRKYDPNSLVDQVESVFTGALNDPARVITDAERAEQVLLLRLYKFNLFTPTPEAARLDTLEESPAAAIGYGVADLAGADERQKDAVILLGRAVDGLAMAGGGAHAEPNATRFLNAETGKRSSFELSQFEMAAIGRQNDNAGEEEPARPPSQAGPRETAPDNIAGETNATKIGKDVHSEEVNLRRATGMFDVLNGPITDKAGYSIFVPKRIDLQTGLPKPGTPFQTANPDAVSYAKRLIVDDKPLGRPLAKDRQEIIRNINAFEIREGQLPDTIAIQRYDPVTGERVITELFGPYDFLPGRKP